MPVQPRIPSARELIERRTRAASTFAFPSDIESIPHKMIMVFNTYSLPGGRAIENTTEAILDPTCAITLPVPLKIYEPYNITYNSENLGVFGAGLANMFSGGSAGSITGGLQRFIGGAAGAAAAVLGAAALAQARGVGGNLVDRALAAASVTTGLALNPYTVARFKGVPLRGFEFRWKVSPQNDRETESIEQIIDTIRVRMHPEPLTEAGNILLKYPELVTFKILGSEYSAQMPAAPCFVQGFTVDRSGADYPTFFAETGAPVVYFIQMNVVELVPLLRTGDKLEMNNPLYNQ